MATKHWRYDSAVDYIDGIMSEADRDSFEAHLVSGCGTCWNRLDDARGTLDDLKLAGEHKPPQRVADLAVALFSAAGDEGEGKIQVAALVEAVESTAVYRGQIEDREFVFTAGEMAIRLRVEAAENGERTLRGQVFIPGEETLSGTLRLLSSPGNATFDKIADDGTFALGSLAAGLYDLRVLSAKRTIDVRQIDLS